MTQKQKQELINDLCARVPYGVIVDYKENEFEVPNWKITAIYPDTFGGRIGYDKRVGAGSESGSRPFKIGEVKPYLRPMSSMNDKERKAFDKFCVIDEFAWEGNVEIGHKNQANIMSKGIDWLLAHHFDFRGLIEMGLALEAPPEMYDKEESEEGSKIPIPKTVDEAVKTLAKIVSKEDRDYLLENGAISMHHSLGRWIRNEWGLWTGSELKNELKKKGFEHPDDMSNYIIEEFIKYWNNKI